MYIKPPRGDIQLEELTECVTTRFQYFLSRYQSQAIKENENSSLKFEYLTLGTALDRVGHFTLRLLAAHCDDLSQFIGSSEASFFVERLELSSPKQIVQFINTTLRHLEESGKSDFGLLWRNEFSEILSLMRHAFKSSHMNGFSHDQTCCHYVCKVPFQMCLKMVAKRELQLEKGNVLVPCGKWKQFLHCFAEDFYLNEVFKMKSSPMIKEFMSDDRLIEIKKEVVRIFYSNSQHSLSKETIRPNEIKELHKLFPPCMANLYNNLKKNHRLSHYARFNFSLFLKDIGMSLNDSIAFWKSEYSQPSKCAGKCSHSWQKDSAKYTYSIRHLYGLEGKRANYRAPSCYKIQNNNLGPVEEGGCPFLTFDAKQLGKCIEPYILQNKEQVIETILQLKSDDHTKACDYYRKTLLKEASVEVSNDAATHRSPVEYFNLSKNLLFDRSIKE